MASTKKVTLKSSDGETFDVDEAVASQSQLIKNMIEDDCADNSIPLPNVTGEILVKVIEYCKKHVEMQRDGVERAIEEKLKSLDSMFVKVDLAVLIDQILNLASSTVEQAIEEELKLWDSEFVKVDQAVLFDITLAANYLNIKSLLDLTCQTVADMIKGKSPDELRKTFNIKNDFTPEEEVWRERQVEEEQEEEDQEEVRREREEEQEDGEEVRRERQEEEEEEEEEEVRRERQEDEDEDEDEGEGEDEDEEEEEEEEEDEEEEEVMRRINEVVRIFERWQRENQGA